jgi:SagB-type dehydrogenase family enzyme
MTTKHLPLPKPIIRSGPSLEQALAQRRSHRTFADRPVPLADLAQLLWAGQGLSGVYDGRTAPSAGGMHLMQLHIVAAHISGLEPGVYRYQAGSHEVEVLATGDLRDEVRDATSDQECLGEGAADIIIGVAPAAAIQRYGERGIRYLHMEAGHVAQNICLQATALGLAATTVAAFDDEAMACAARLRSGEQALYAIPVGHAR